MTVEPDTLGRSGAEPVPLAIGSLVEVRDEKWLVESCSATAEG